MSEKDRMNFHIRATLSSSPKLGDSMNNSHESNQELKPCPFCAGKARLFSKIATSVIECQSCGVRTNVFSGRNDGLSFSSDEAERLAVKSWNHRTDEWISVDDKLPEIGQQCLIEIPVCDNFNIENGKYKGNGVWVGAWCDSRGNGCHYKVTRWMPRP